VGRLAVPLGADPPGDDEPPVLFGDVGAGGRAHNARKRRRMQAALSPPAIRVGQNI
jgi:hypothetical protein